MVFTITEVLSGKSYCSDFWRQLCDELQGDATASWGLIVICVMLH